MVKTMEEIIEGTIELQESLLALIFNEFRAGPMLQLAEIPVGERDPKRPVRLCVVMANMANAPGPPT